MIDPAQLLFDASGNVASIAIPGVLWALLFLLAWERLPFAESIGFGRRTFWLLLPGALLASFALLPLAPISNDWLAIDLAGAVFPILVGLLAFRKYDRPSAPSLATFLGLLAAETAVLLLLVLPGAAPRLGVLFGTLVPAPERPVLWVSLVAAAWVLAAGAALAVAAPSPARRRVAFLFGLASGVMALTFAGSSTIPGVGIVESYPFYLFPPLIAGIVAGLLAPRVFPGEEGFALPAAYLATTLGVLVGADVLRQPPLYGHGAPGLYTIGGAGLLDLIYLSGLLALGGAWLIHALEGREWSPIGPTLPAAEATPVATLRAARLAGIAGRAEESLQASARAARGAAARTRTLYGLADAPANRPWDGLPVPGWVVSDQANLDRSAQLGTTDAREAFRAWVTSRALVVVAHQIAQPKYGSILARIAAFLIDLAVVGAAASLLFVGVVLGTPGSVDAVLGSLALNTAVYGVIAAAFFYFVLAETLAGTTLGKRAMGLSVRDRHLGKPAALSALVRNAPLVPTLTIVSLGAGIASAILVKGPSSVGTTLAGIGIPGDLTAIALLSSLVLGGVAFLGAFGVFAIALTEERQRIGDLWAGTWVVRRPTAPPAAPPRVPPADPFA
jgi:uncharacterized membrane protein/uncharacterized RDD family membrane protein YckC